MPRSTGRLCAAFILLLPAAACRNADPQDACQQEMHDSLMVCLSGSDPRKPFLEDLCRQEYEERLALCP